MAAPLLKKFSLVGAQAGAQAQSAPAPVVSNAGVQPGGGGLVVATQDRSTQAPSSTLAIASGPPGPAMTAVGRGPIRSLASASPAGSPPLSRMGDTLQPRLGDSRSMQVLGSLQQAQQHPHMQQQLLPVHHQVRMPPNLAMQPDQNPIDDLGKILNQQTKMIKQLEVRVQEESTKVAQVMQQLSTANEKVAFQADEAAKMRADVQRVEGQLKAKDDECKQLSQKIVAIESERSCMTRQVVNARKELDKTKRSYALELHRSTKRIRQLMGLTSPETHEPVALDPTPVVDLEKQRLTGEIDDVKKQLLAKSAEVDEQHRAALDVLDQNNGLRADLSLYSDACCALYNLAVQCQACSAKAEEIQRSMMAAQSADSEQPEGSNAVGDTDLGNFSNSVSDESVATA